MSRQSPATTIPLPTSTLDEEITNNVAAFHFLLFQRDQAVIGHQRLRSLGIHESSKLHLPFPSTPLLLRLHNDHLSFDGQPNSHRLRNREQSQRDCVIRGHISFRSSPVSLSQSVIITQEAAEKPPSTSIFTLVSLENMKHVPPSKEPLLPDRPTHFSSKRDTRSTKDRTKHFIPTTDKM